MKNNIAVWFVVGFLAGAATIFAAISIVPSSAIAFPTEVRLVTNPQLEAEQVRLLRNFSDAIDSMKEQFTEASDDADESMLQSDLQTVRSQIELYKVQHLDAVPDTSTSAAFVTCLTAQTNQAGGTGTDYGPYLQKMPTNPFNNKSDIKFGDVPSTTFDSGWYFDKVLKKLAPNDNATHAAL